MKYHLAIFLLATVPAAAACGGQKTYVGQEVPAANRVSFDQIDHAAWNQLLEKYVDERGGVNYRGWKATAKDVAHLEAYLAQLSHASLTAKSTRGAQLAYFINAYNAVTIRGILQHYPTSSIRNHTAKLVGFNIWHDLLLHVDGKTVSLDEIEHKVLRKMQEPRVHFAIVCASISCPRLLNEAYTAERLETQLVANTKDFFANPGNFQYDSQHGAFRLSAILDWFGSDFGADSSAVLKWIARYLPDPQSAQAASAGQGRVSYLDYDWGLNEAASIPPQGSGTQGSGTSIRSGRGATN